MAPSSPSSSWEDLDFKRELPKAKPILVKLLLDSLQSNGSVQDDRSEQPCGTWLLGALSMSLADVLDINPISPVSTKKSKPAPTTEGDSRFLTALLRFVAQMRSETGMEDLFARLNNTDGCYCSKVEDTREKRYILVHTPHDIGRSMMEGYRKSGHFLPLIRPRLSVSRHVQILPQMFIHLRGRGSSTLTDLQVHQYLPPIRQPNYASPAVGFITIVFGFLASILEPRISLSFSKGRAKYWPYSPRDFILLVRIPAAESASTSTPDDTAACASDLMSAIQEWSYWMPNPSPAFLLSKIVDMCGTLLVPAVVDYCYSITTLPDVARDIIQDAMTTLREVDLAEPSLSHFSSRKTVGDFVYQHCDTIANYYWVVLSRRDVPFEWNDTLLPDNCLRMAQLFTTMMYLLEDSRIPYSIRNSDKGKRVRESMRHLCFNYHSMARLLSHGQEVSYPAAGMVCHPRLAQYYADVRKGKDPNQMFIVDPQIKPHEGTARVERAREHFLLVLPTIRLRTYCFAWGCSKSVQEVGTEFKACAACGIVKYCGRVCQKLDWKGFTSSGDPLAQPQLHHSKICSLLKNFSTGSSDKDTFGKEVILEDQNWHTLSTWTKGLYSPEAGLPQSQAFEEPSSLDSETDESTIGWKDFNDVLLEFVVLASAPEPVSITWLPINRD